MSDFYQVSRADLEAINRAMNHMGDVLNGMDAVEEEDEAATEAGFKAIQAILASHPSNAVQDVHPDDVAVDTFAAAMKGKLALAREKGRGGWEQCDPADLSRMLREHVEKGDPRDVANFCMFLWCLGQPISATPAVSNAVQDARDIPTDTGNPEADRIIRRLASSDPDFDDCTAAAAFIYKLVAEHRGPEGFATWKDAAFAERMKRVELEQAATVPPVVQAPSDEQIRADFEIWHRREMPGLYKTAYDRNAAGDYTDQLTQDDWKRYEHGRKITSASNAGEAAQRADK